MDYAENMTRRLREFKDLRNKLNTESTASTGLERQASTEREEALLEYLLDQEWKLAREVSLTSMPSLPGIACKALYLLECLEEEPGDLATELARSLAKDVLAIADA